MHAIAGLKPLEEIADIDTPLQLDCFGGIYNQQHDPDNAVVECLLTPISDNYRGYNYKQQLQVEVAVGYLPALYVGHRFERGRIVDPQSWQKSHDLTIEVDLLKHPPVETTFASLDPQLVAPPIKRNCFQSAQSAGLKMLQAQVLDTSTGPNTYQPKATVLIQEIELIRFYHCSSSKLAQTIFNGDLCRGDWLNTICNQIHEKAYLDKATKHARFVHRHSYTKADAPVLARMIFDESMQPLRSAQRVFQTRQASQINASKLLSVSHPRTLFPYQGTITLRIRGVWKQLRKNYDTEPQQYAFLAQRILSCSSPFPFQYLSYANELSPGGAAADAEAPIAFSGVHRTKSTLNGSNTGLSRTKEQPNILSALRTLELSARNFADLDPDKIVKEKLRDCTHQGVKNEASSTSMPLTNVSTGLGTYGASTSARLSISDIATAPVKLSAGLEAFTNIIDRLRKNQPEWCISFIDIGDDSIDGASCTFPVIPCAKRKNIFRKFSFMDEERSSRRRFLCAEIILPNGQNFYAFEMERRVKPTALRREIMHLDTAPIAVIFSLHFQSLKKIDFSLFLVQSIKKRTWALHPNISSLCKLDVKHSDTDSTTNRLEKLITSLSLPRK